MTTFACRPLAELVVNFDRRRRPVKGSDRRPGPYPYYGASGIVDHVDDYLFEGLHVLVSEDGENLRSRSTPVAFIADGRFWVNNHAHVLVGNQNNDTRYLAYAIEASDISGYITGSAQPKLSQSALASIKVPAPDLLEQRAIAATLGALDDKIASNRRLIRLIPSLIRAHVDAAMGVNADDVTVSSLALFVNGGAYTKGASGTGRMVLRIAELNGDPGASTVYNNIDVPANRTARAGDILMSWSGSLGVYRWFRAEAIINQHIFKVIPNGCPDWLVFDRLDAVMPVFQSVARDKATTMGHIQRGHLETTRVHVPDKGNVVELNVRLGPLWERLLIAEREATALASLRDVLLPELLSGRTRVGDEVSV